MSRNNLTYLLSLSVLLSLGLISCFRSSTPPAPDMAGGVYEYAGYEFFHWQEGLDIMIWHDAISSGTCNSSGTTDNDTHLVQCQAASENGFDFFWQIETNDGRTAQFSINNQPFNLADGTVFLVTTADGQVNIQQLQRDLASIEANDPSITAYSLADPEISQFIQSTAPEE